MVRHGIVLLAIAALFVALGGGCDSASDPKVKTTNAATIKALDPNKKGNASD